MIFVIWNLSVECKFLPLVPCDVYYPYFNPGVVIMDINTIELEAILTAEYLAIHLGSLLYVCYDGIGYCYQDYREYRR